MTDPTLTDPTLNNATSIDTALNNLALNDLDELYFLAQLLAEDETHAARLVEQAVSKRASGSILPAGPLLLSLGSTPSGHMGPDLLQAKQIQLELNSVLPGILTSTSPARRIAIYQAFTGASHDPAEKTTFMHRVRRALELHSSLQNPTSVSEREVSVALSRYMGHTLDPIPASLRSALLSEYGSEQTLDTMNGRRDRPALKGKSSMAVKVAGSIVLILLASAIGTWIAKPPAMPTNNSGQLDMLQTIDQYDPNSDWAFEGSDPVQLEQVLKERTGQKVQVPELSNATLRGLSIEAISASLTLPVLHYELEGKTINVFILDYNTIQVNEVEYHFDPQVLNQIAQPRGLAIKQLEVGSRMTFRNRDDVYITHTEGNPQELRNRFSFDR